MDSPIVSDILAFLVLIATKYCVNSTKTSSRAAIKLERSVNITVIDISIPSSTPDMSIVLV